MSDPPSPLRILKQSWTVGDQRQVPVEAVDSLRGTDAYESYNQLYSIEGRQWRIEGHLTHADGQRYYLLVCVNG